MAAFMIATGAIREAGVELAGSIYLSMVAVRSGRSPSTSSRASAT